MASNMDDDEGSLSQSPEETSAQDMGSHESQVHTKVEEDGSGITGHKKVDPKDPLRPRRKKARRACYACQRAHLTCGDERPCQRCIKRGLQDACQDGVRKKAKYLHDAPSEALLPGAEHRYQYLRNPQQSQQQQSPQSPTYPIDQSMSDMYTPRQIATQLPLYSRPSTADQLPLTEALINSSTYASHASPVVAQFQDPLTLQTSMGGFVQSINPIGSVADSGAIQDYTSNLFEGADLTQYKIDPASFNFGNHYGALEFGMLGQMAIGAGETPPSDHTAHLGRNDSIISNTGSIPSAYVDSSVVPGYIFGQDQNMTNWQTPTQTQSNLRTRPASSFSRKAQEQPNAFSIGANSAFASPTSEMSPAASKAFDEIPSKTLFTPSASSDSRPSTQHGRPMSSPHRQFTQGIVSARAIPSKRVRGDPSQIYRTVQQPHSYTTAFHNFTGFMRDRFTDEQTVRIAKSMSDFRPSFIACTNTLCYEDLVFMEQYFQRSLFDYEHNMGAIGTPTIICRRTGEVVLAGKEFCILTGWKKDILLGREANLNINRGTMDNPIGAANDTPSKDTATPKLPEGVLEASNQLRPVFVAELLDDDSVFQFYEDFSRLAYGDSHGTVLTPCKLLKYRTKDYYQDPLASAGNNNIIDESSRSLGKRKRVGTSNRRDDIAGEARIDELGDKDGKVDCMCSWMVRRDLFDLPMMIIMNFLPVI